MGTICKGRRFAGWTNPRASLDRIIAAEHPHSDEEMKALEREFWKAWFDEHPRRPKVTKRPKPKTGQTGGKRRKGRR